MREDDSENQFEGGTGFIETDESIIVIGDKALAYASCNHGETQRPMVKGVLSPDDNAETIMSVIIEKVIGKAKKQGEVCRFSVPAEPFDDEEIDIVFHEGMLMAILENLGYDPRPLNEAEAVCYSELSSDDDQLTGGSFSFGGGQSNGAILFEGNSVISFSVARGGDWIDQKSFKHARMQSSAEMTQYKETEEYDLLKPKGRAASALSMYFKHHVKYVIGAVAELLNKEEGHVPNFRKPIKWVVSGGTSLANGCLELVKREFEKHTLPFELKSVVYAEEPLNSTAKGCLIAARLDENE